MQNLGAALAEDGSERAGVFLTNALTGWEPQPNKPLPFPELEDRARTLGSGEAGHPDPGDPWQPVLQRAQPQEGPFDWCSEGGT